METVEKYLRMARNGKLKCWLVLGCLWIIGIICFGFAIVSLLIIFSAVYLFVLMHQYTVTWKKHGDNYIIFYNALINGYLIINNEIQSIGGATQYDFYGQLPDGTDVYVKMTKTGSVRFIIGESKNVNLMHNF